MGKIGDLQNLSDFTVQIRSCYSANSIIGTGILVSMDGKIVTCTHVLESAAEVGTPEELNDIAVPVYMQQVPNCDTNSLQAKVIDFLPSTDDDIALLQLVDDKITIEPKNVAVLGKAKSSENKKFQSYGYCGLERYQATRADGVILGHVRKEGKMRFDRIQLRSSQINQGMSGAAVLDIERNLVVGIVSETWHPDKSTKHRDTSWGIDMAILKSDKFNSYGIPVLEAYEIYEGINKIEKRLTCKDIEVRRAQVERLGKMGYPFALSLLVPRLSKLVEPDSFVRSWVAYAIGDIGGRNAKEALINAKASESDAIVKQGIEYGLKKLGHKLN